MITESERRRMLRAHSIGPKMIDYLEVIGIDALDELGRGPIKRMGITALDNLIALARSES